MRILEIETPHGRAKAHLHPAGEPRAALVLGHGAAGGVSAPDLVAVTDVARSEGISVALVEQPYRVAGRRSPAPARQLDAAWTAVVEHLVTGELRGLPLVAGGRSLELVWPAARPLRPEPSRCSASRSRCSRRAGRRGLRRRAVYPSSRR